MFKGIVVRLYPNKEQEVLFEKNCGCVRKLYNEALAYSIKTYKETGKRPSSKVLSVKLPKLKKEHPYLAEADAVSLQQSLRHLEKAYQNAFHRIKKGEKAGFPKFKRKGEYDSFKLTQASKIRLHSSNILKLGKHGLVKFRGNEDRLQGKKIKSITVSKDAGKWYASCLVEAPEFIEHVHKYEAVGIDIGVAIPLTLAFESDGEIVHKEIGHNFSKCLAVKERRRERYQRAYSRKAKGSNNQQKAKLKVQRAFQKERQFRKNFIEQTSHKLSHLFEVVKFEDLSIRNMTKQVRKNEDETPRKGVAAKSGLNRQLLRIGFSKLVKRCKQKALEKGGSVLKVDPKFTSKECSCCGFTHKDNRKSQAEFQCLSCGYQSNADYNASSNILFRKKGLVTMRNNEVKYKHLSLQTQLP